MNNEMTFIGAINLVDWWQDPYMDQSFRTIVGKISIKTETELGMKIRTVGGANYLVTVSGAKTTIHFPGCKVLAFMEMKSETVIQVPQNAYRVP